MRSALAILLLAAALGLAACGDDDTTTVTETVLPTETEATETELTEPTAGKAPSGELSSAGIGEVTVGATTEDVRELFGAADNAVIVPGCELAGPNAEEVITWTYQVGDDDLVLTFGARSAELTFYRSLTAALETTRGDRIGDTYADVKANWGDELEPVPIGQPTPKNGLWWVREGKQELVFDIVAGEVGAISGGDFQFCE